MIKNNNRNQLLVFIIFEVSIVTALLIIGTPGMEAYAQLALSVSLVHCTDVTATERGVAINFIISGLSHSNTIYTFQLISPSGNLIRNDNLNQFIPPTAPEPSTLFFNIGVPSANEGQYTAIVTGTDGS